MATLHIFNPETDIILGLNQPYYTPGKYIDIFKRKLSLLPSIFANRQDYILIENKGMSDIRHLPFYELVKQKDITVINFDELKKLNENSKSAYFSEIHPWGWNPEIVRKLSEAESNNDFLPNQSFLESLRNLANREITLKFFEVFRDNISPGFISPKLLKSIAEAELFLQSNSTFCLKAPWSSSGRGLLFSNTLSNIKTLEWTKGIIRSQGAVMAETLYTRKIDFASEWVITKSGDISFSGLSLFNSSNRGKYQGNILMSQQEINSYLCENSNWDDSFLEMQRRFIGENIAKSYSGPVGFDMLVDENKEINPCVEINIRNTMGHVAIEVEKMMTSDDDSIIRATLDDYFPDKIFSLKKIIDENKD